MFFFFVDNLIYQIPGVVIALTTVHFKATASFFHKISSSPQHDDKLYGPYGGLRHFFIILLKDSHIFKIPELV